RARAWGTSSGTAAPTAWPRSPGTSSCASVAVSAETTATSTRCGSRWRATRSWARPSAWRDWSSRPGAAAGRRTRTASTRCWGRGDVGRGAGAHAGLHGRVLRPGGRRAGVLPGGRHPTAPVDFVTPGACDLRLDADNGCRRSRRPPEQPPRGSARGSQWREIMAILNNYETGETIREATLEELLRSVEAGQTDGGAGVIEVDGVRCYVDGDLVEAGEPGTEDYDTGRVVEVAGDLVTVVWDGSLVTTTQRASALRIA